MPALFITIVHAQFVIRLVARVGMAFFVQVVGVLAVNTTGLEVLALALRGTLLVIAFVVVVTTIVAEIVLLLSTMMTTRIVIVAPSIRPVALALIGEMAHLVCVLLLQLPAHLAPCFCSNLFELMVLEARIVLTSLMDQLEVLCKGSVVSCHVIWARIARSPHNQTCGRSCRTIPLVAARWAFQYCPRVGGLQCASSPPINRND